MSNRQIGPVARALMRGKARIENIKNWTQGRLHRGNDRHCALGAMQDFMTDDYVRAARFLGRAAEALFPGYQIVLVNDHLGHAATMAMYDRAILDAIREGK